MAKGIPRLCTRMILWISLDKPVGLWYSAVMRKIEFHIEFPGERAAGFMPYSETVRIEIANGEMPAYALCQLTEALRETLRDFYDGAKVVTKEVYDAEIEAQSQVASAVDQTELHDQQAERGVMDAMGRYHGPASKGGR